MKMEEIGVALTTELQIQDIFPTNAPKTSLAGVVMRLIVFFLLSFDTCLTTHGNAFFQRNRWKVTLEKHYSVTNVNNNK